MTQLLVQSYYGCPIFLANETHPQSPRDITSSIGNSRTTLINLSALTSLVASNALIFDVSDSHYETISPIMGQIYASISKNTQPTCVNKDLRIISKLWVDALDDESDIEL